MDRLFADVRPAHPGSVFLDTVLIPLGMTQRAAAKRLMISYPRMNEIIREKRRVTPDTALRFARFSGTLPEIWLEYQLDIDLWEALDSPLADEVMEIRPIRVGEAPGATPPPCFCCAYPAPGLSSRGSSAKGRFACGPHSGPRFSTRPR